MLEKSFETEVLERLAVIEAKLDDYKSIKEKAEDAYNLSKSNEKRIDKFEDSNRWLSRTAFGAIVVSVISIVFLWIQLSLGLK